MSTSPNEQTAPNALLNKSLTAVALEALREQASFLKECPSEEQFVWLYRTAYRLVRMWLTDEEVKAVITALMGREPDPDNLESAMRSARAFKKAVEES